MCTSNNDKIRTLVDNDIIFEQNSKIIRKISNNNIRQIITKEDIKIARESKEYAELIDLYEIKHVYDFEIVQKSTMGYNIEEMRNLIDCIKNNEIPSNNHVKFALLKYTQDFKKDEILKMLLNNYYCALLVFSMMCHKDDKELYRNEFFNSNILKDNPDYANYLQGKVLISEELVKKAKSKELLLNGLNYLNKVSNEFTKSIPYLKHLAYYYIGNFDKSLDYLVDFLSKIRFFNPELCQVEIDKLNKLKLYIEINKMSNAHLFTSITNKLKEDDKLKRFDNKINKDESIKCDHCKSGKVTVQYYECKHYYCVDCIKNKSCNLCKLKHYS
jgi:hypothetical protein